MAMFYYYIDYDYRGIKTKKGPYTIAELQALNLPVETLIWSDGWAENKPISDCPEVMEYFTLNPPEIPTTPIDVEPVTPEPEMEVEEIHPEMHWLPRTLLYFGVIGSIGQIILNCTNADSGAEVVLELIFGIWGIASIIGMIATKKWGLISYFAYRFITLFIVASVVDSGAAGDEVAKDFIRLIMTIGIFFIKNDGYNVYQLLWNNGVFHVKKEKPVTETVEDNGVTETQVIEEKSEL